MNENTTTTNENLGLSPLTNYFDESLLDPSQQYHTKGSSGRPSLRLTYSGTAIPEKFFFSPFAKHG